MGIKSNNPAVDYFNFFSETGIKGAVRNHNRTPITATGGSKETPGNGYVYHRFNTGFPGAVPVAAFVITSGTEIFDCVVMGAGCGGGYDRGGGGGGGAFRPLSLEAVPGTHPLSLGTKGAGGSVSGHQGGIGGDTTFTFNGTAYVANGGGGGSGDGNTNGLDSPGNGSGGGTTGSPVGSAPWSGGAGGAFGNPGKGSPENGTGGGGGGAGSGGPADPTPSTSTTGFIGGAGKTVPWLDPTSGHPNAGYYCGGGGGGGYQYPTGTAQPPTPMSGPGAGAGRGGVDGPPGTMNAGDAAPGTASGGGGGPGSGTRDGGDGSDGVMFIRYSAS